MNTVIIRELGHRSYLSVFEKMKLITQHRNQKSFDELWLLQHEPVFTQGLAGKSEHILNPHDIPVVASDRVGQVTYHGPGQLIAYALIDITRKNLTIRQLVHFLEQVIIDLLKKLDITAKRIENAPGVYIENKKIASLGLRVRKGCSYHGLALNYKMDLTPFSYINPCGFKNLEMTEINAYNAQTDFAFVQSELIHFFCHYFDYNNILMTQDFA